MPKKSRARPVQGHDVNKIKKRIASVLPRSHKGAKTRYLPRVTLRVHKDTDATTSPKLSHRVPALEMKRESRSALSAVAETSYLNLEYDSGPQRLRLPQMR